MSKFDRDHMHYIVQKRHDVISYLSGSQQKKYVELLDIINKGRKADYKDIPNYVVVREGWPMYEKVWRAIEKWIEEEDEI